MPATQDTLAAYLLLDAPRLSRGALGRRRSAIAAVHRQAGLPPPQLDAAGRQALRTASRPASDSRSARGPTVAGLLRMAAKCPRDAAGLRDRALFLLVAATSRPTRQRSNHTGDGARVPRLVLLALDSEDVRFTPEGAVLQLRMQPDDATPSRAVVVSRASVPATCPVRALEDWLRGSDTSFGPVFRKVDRWGNVEHRRLGADAWHRILARRAQASSARDR